MIYCFLLFNIMFENNVLPLVIGEMRFKFFFIIFINKQEIWRLMGYISKQINFGGRIIINENIHTVIYNIVFATHCYVLEGEKNLTNAL